MSRGSWLPRDKIDKLVKTTRFINTFRGEYARMNIHDQDMMDIGFSRGIEQQYKKDCVIIAEKDEQLKIYENLLKSQGIDFSALKK